MDIVSIAIFTTMVGFVGCLVAIAVCDLGSFTIPNSISVVLIWLFLVSLPFARSDLSLASHVYSFLIVATAGLFAFRFGLFGGGDVKSWAAIALWYDLNGLSLQVLSVALIGGTLGLLTLTLRRVAASAFVQHHLSPSRLPRLLHAGEPVPYGVAIALGTALSIGHVDLF
jgi:prepilin peptidase CpaA